MPVPANFQPRHVVTAQEWNNVSALVNANESNSAALTSRVSTMETRTTDSKAGNSALNTRLTTVESATTNASTGNTQLGSRVSTLESRTADSSTGNAALGSRVSNLENSGAWTDITLANGWANRTGGKYRAQALVNGALKRVYIVGTIQNSAAVGSSAYANGAKIGQLPAGMYPAAETIAPILESGGNGRGMRIDTSGGLYIYAASPVASTLIFDMSFTLSGPVVTA